MKHPSLVVIFGVASSQQNFVGREKEIAVLDELLHQVKASGHGRMVTLRGRRQVGKSTMTEVFCERAKVPFAYFQAARHRAPEIEIDLFRSIVASQLPEAQPLIGSARFSTWDGLFAAVAATITSPTIVVIDELPWLIETDRSVEGALQTAWDRHLRSKPILIVLIGSDLAMMEALTAYERPLCDRSTTMAVNPLPPSDVAKLLSFEPAVALDTFLITGGFPNLVNAARRHANPDEFLSAELTNPTSALIVAGERVLAAEFPHDLPTRPVLEAIGLGERERSAIANASGVAASSLDRALDLLIDKRIVAKLTPVSAVLSHKNTRYQIVDPYLRFWLRYVASALPEIERGRGEKVAQRVIADFATFAGKSIEPVVGECLTRRLPDRAFGDATDVGAYWTRDGKVEVDLVGIHTRTKARRVDFVGSVKWRKNASFDADDLNALRHHATSVPGAGEITLRVGVSRSGFDVAGLDVALSPVDLLATY